MDDYVTTKPRLEQEKLGMMRTFTGRYVCPLRLRARDIDIRDIAHHLALINRYTGATPEPYSVAQHSVWVSIHLRQNGASYELALAGLLHDAAEAYFNDLASPVKHDARLAEYSRLEHETGRMILARFGLDPDLLAKTKPADDAAFFAETRSWWGGSGEIHPWSWAFAEEEFLDTFCVLTELIDS